MYSARPGGRDLRQVPDTQEVFLSNDSDLSLILEVLELVRDEGAQDDLDSAIRLVLRRLSIVEPGPI